MNMNVQAHQQAMQQALRLFQSNRLQEARNLLEQITSQVKNDAGAWHMLGAVQRRIGDFDASKKSLNKSIKLNNRQPDVWNTLGILNRNSGDFSGALSCYTSALKLTPSHLDALNNKGHLLNQMERWSEAETCFQKAVKVKPDNQSSLVGYGDALKGMRKFELALEMYERVLAINPQDLMALNNKSVVLKKQGKWKLAIECLENAITLAPESSQIRHNLASSYASDCRQDDAVKLYKKMIDSVPDDVSAHIYLNQILWTQGSEDFLKSYESSKRIRPNSVEIRMSYAGQLMQAERFEEAEQEIQSALKMEPKRHDLRFMNGRIFKEQCKFNEAIDEFRAASKLAPNHMGIHAAMGETLLGMGEGGEALKIYNKLLKVDPDNIGWWGLKADALRMTGNDEYKWLYDYDRLVLISKIDVPDGYRNIDAFNEALLHDLEKFHVGKEHPLDQSLRSGTQTVGNIFDVQQQTIQQLKSAMSDQIRDFIAALPDDNRHPILKNKSKEFEYIGSWSVRLRKEGFHANHNHLEGWFSGPYYVSLPDIVKDKNNQQGNIQFGQPGYKAIEPLEPELVVAPEEGSMVLFPSYMWHGTIPFESDQYRVSVSQDLIRQF